MKPDGVEQEPSEQRGRRRGLLIVMLVTIVWLGCSKETPCPACPPTKAPYFPAPDEMDAHDRATLRASVLTHSLGQLLRARQLSRRPETLEPAIRTVLIEVCGGADYVQQSPRAGRLVEMNLDVAFPPEKVRQAAAVDCGVMYLADGQEVVSPQ